MRKLSKDDLDIIHTEKDMLEGNINRMCVTHNMDELLSMRYFAIIRIEHIFKINHARLTEKEDLNAE